MVRFRITLVVLTNKGLSFISVAVFSTICVFLSKVLLSLPGGFKTPDMCISSGTEKLSPYECGFEPFSAGSGAFDVHFYIVGVLFIIFDLEIVFLYPWAVNLSVLGISGFFSMLVFLLVLTLGFVFE
jgi:NADH-quinone oxidoreductase subunit A